MDDNLTLIDTDILIFILKNHENAIKWSRAYQIKYGKLQISELTYYECLRGYEATKSIKKLQLFQAIAAEMEIYPLNKPIYDKASEIYAQLQSTGFPTGEFDILLAATALIHDFTFSTNNTKHYLKIQAYFGLNLVNWTK
jgi:tRNA(fMet)-specific endonuclease VapC